MELQIPLEQQESPKLTLTDKQKADMDKQLIARQEEIKRNIATHGHVVKT